MTDTTLYTDQSIPDQMVCNPGFSDWHLALHDEKPLTNFPRFPWGMVTNPADGFPVLEARKTISRSLISASSTDRKICPYGDKPAQLAIVKPIPDAVLVRSSYALSALRFQLNPFHKDESCPEEKTEGIPSVFQALYDHKAAYKKPEDHDEWLKLPTLRALDTFVDAHQKEMRTRYSQEVIPFMNANPLDPTVHRKGRSPQFIHDLEQYVRLQNRPYLFFELMQWLERDIATRRWRSAQSRQLLSPAKALRWVMDSWTDRDGTRRKKAITCPTGVPLGYMQSVRRKNQPFITQEFAEHAHGAFNHWLQEHIWQRFYYCYSEQCQLPPAEFFKQIGKASHTIADAIYELHMPSVANPANTNFWSVLQFYLPFMSPWP